MLIEAKASPARLFNKHPVGFWSGGKYYPPIMGAATGTAMTDYLEDRFLNHFFRATASTAPATVYLGLFTANPGEAGGGTEATSGSYARKSIAFDAPSGGAIANQLCTFVTATADWSAAANITGWMIFDHLTQTTQPLVYGTFTVAQPVLSGNTFSVPAGNLILTAD